MDNPFLLLKELRPRLTERKVRLVVCAAARMAWRLLHDPRSRRAIETSERFADGAATAEELHIACRRAREVGSGDAVRAASYAAKPPGEWYRDYWWWDFGYVFTEAAGGLAAEAARAVPPDGPWVAARDAAYAAAQTAQVGLLRDLIAPEGGVRLEPAWLAWNDGAVRKMARAAYEEHAFDSLPLLADALEEAGCTDAAVLAHLRGPGPHARGCWILDSLLSKE